MCAAIAEEILDGGAAAPDHEIAIIGTGFAGLGMAIRLKQQGRDDFVILERESEIGGTWYLNHYPGCACDVPSHLYSFSFEPNPDWTRLFAPQPEIRAYLERCVDKYGLRDHIHLDSEVSEARFDEETGLWHLRAGGRSVTARSVGAGLGPLTRPAYPDIPGIERFRGETFHSQQWDHDCDLSGKRVAVIGTGASAIQFVPQIAPDVQRLHLFQRTPPWIMPKPDHPIGRRMRERFRRRPGRQRFLRRFIYWFLEARVLGFVVSPRLMKLMEHQARRHLRRQVPDPELRGKLTPDYTLGCKRVLISEDYYPALSRENVDLETEGVREITETGLVTGDGREIEVDVMIFGTGFQATEPVPRGMIFGRGGRDIVDAWADGVEAYKGTTVSGYPNFYLMTGPNTGLGHSSMVFMIESQIEYVLGALRTLRRRDLKFLDVRPEAQREYNEWLQARLAGTIWNTGGCRSWYLDANGKNVTLWPGFTWQFRLMTRRFDAARYERAPRASGRVVPAATNVG